MSEYRRQVLVGGVVAFVVGVIVIASVAYLPLVGNITTTLSQHTTSTIVTTSTLNNYSTSAETTNSSLITTAHSQDDSWSLSLSANYTKGVVAKGDVIDLDGNLTYIGASDIILSYSAPLLAGLQVMSENGSVAWGFYPPGLTYLNQTIKPGESFAETLSIPTSSFSIGQNYSITFSPTLYTPQSQRIEQNLSATLSFIVAPSLGSSTFTTSVTCTVSGEPTGFYLHVISDGTPKPIEGAVLNATAVGSCGSPSSQILTTNSTGWAAVSMPIDVSGNFFMAFNVQYSNSTFSFSKSIQASWFPQQGTFVTLSLPSGTVSTVHLFPMSCNGACYYENIPQIVTIARPNATYTVQLFTNNTLTSGIQNISLITNASNLTQAILLYVPAPSYLFAIPSFAINNSGSVFYIAYQNGTLVPTAPNRTDNLLYTTHQVRGWILVYSTPS